MIQIKTGDLTHAKDISQFQQKLAWQTEHLKLHAQIVDQAVIYIIKNPHYGQYFIAVDTQSAQPNRARGSLLMTYQNQRSWWMQSVYVQEPYRRKGIFTMLFNSTVKAGKVKGANKIQLFVEKQNNKARLTYQKLGMHCNGNQFIGYQLVYGEQQLRHELSTKLHQGVEIRQSKTQHDKQQIMKQVQQSKLINISGKSEPLNYKMLCVVNKQVIGYCEYFYQFSDWRFGLVVYLNCIMAKEGRNQETIDVLNKHIYQKSPFKVAAIRIITHEEKEMKVLQEAAKKLHRDVYDVMQIDF